MWAGRTVATVTFAAEIVAQATQPIRFQFLPFAVQVWVVVVLVMSFLLSVVLWCKHIVP